MKFLPSGWTIKKSSEFCLKVADGTHDTPKPEQEGRLLITSKNLKGGRVNFDGAYMISESDYQQINKRSKVDEWDVLFSMIGTVGEIALVRSKPDYAIKNIGLFKNNSKEDGIWLYYYLSSSIGQAALDTFLSGTSQQFVALGDLRKVPVIVPLEAGKKKIAAILSAYDDLIENNQRRIALLEKMAEEIYREWFVRMRFPGHEKVAKVKGVPEGWEIKKLGSVLELCYGKALKDDDRVPGEFLVYGSSGVVGTHNEALVKTPSLIVGRKGNVGSVYWPDRGFFPIDTVYFVKSELPNSFLYFLLRSMNFINNDAAVPGLNRNQAYSNLFLLPPDPLIKKYAEVADSQFEMKRFLTQQNENLRSTRDRLLPRLISGKLSIENLDIQFPPGMEEAAHEA